MLGMPRRIDEPLLISAEGYERRSRELDELRNEARRDLAERLRQARESGELDDSLAVQELIEEQARLERRIATLEAQLASARIVAPTADGHIGIGSVVRVREEDGSISEYELVGPLESDVDKGRISVHTPVGQALIGRRAGASVAAATPRGPLTLEVISVGRRDGGVREA